MLTINTKTNAAKYLNPGFRPNGWTIVSEVRYNNDVGALLKSPSGRYMIGNASCIKSLPQDKVVKALLGSDKCTK